MNLFHFQISKKKMNSRRSKLKKKEGKNPQGYGSMEQPHSRPQFLEHNVQST